MRSGRWLPLLSATALLATWAAAVWWLAIPGHVAPSPLAVVQTLWHDAGTLSVNLTTTVIESVAGFLLGNLAAVLLAIAFVQKRSVQDAFLPIAALVNTTPIVAIAPILALLLGNDMSPKIAIAALVCFFPTLVNMVRGLSSVNPRSLELMHILAASDYEVLFKLRLPNSLPYLFASLRIATSTAMIGAIVGEWIGSTAGLGALIIQAMRNSDTPLMFASVVLASTFSATFFFLIGCLERRVVTWAAAVGAA